MTFQDWLISIYGKEWSELKKEYSHYSYEVIQEEYFMLYDTYKMELKSSD